MQIARMESVDDLPGSARKLRLFSTDLPWPFEAPVIERGAGGSGVGSGLIGQNLLGRRETFGFCVSDIRFIGKHVGLVWRHLRTGRLGIDRGRGNIGMAGFPQ